jgi:dTMP kinase
MELLHWIFDLEYQFFKIPQPDISVFLHVPMSFVEEQLKAVRIGADRKYLKGKSDIHEQSLDFQKAVEEVYLETCRLMPDRLLYVNCMNEQGLMMSPDEIHEKLVNILKEKQLI